MKKTVKKNQTLSERLEVNSSNRLIIFDKKVKIFIYTNVLILLILSMFKIHGCSISIWNQLFGINEKANRSLIYGEPRGIRQDDWMVAVPFLLSQSNSNFPSSNPSIGAGNPSLLMGLPFKDVISVFRPAIWGFFITDVERAYAFWWNFKIHGMVVGFFLLLLLLTKNNFNLSVFGSLWLYLSSGVQWWSFGIGLYVLSFSMIFVSLVYLLFSDNRKYIIINAFLLTYFAYNFIDMLYPPWQVPLVYMLIIFLAAYLLDNYRKEIIFKFFGFKLICLFISFGVLIVFVLHFYFEAKETIDLMTNTAYPGKRIIKSANLDVSKLFSEYFGFFMTDIKLPTQWLNICEASGFVMFFPIVMFNVIRGLILKTKTDLLLLLMSVFITICLLWMLVPMPDFVGKFTLFSSVPAYRLLVIFGFANIIFTIVYLSRFTFEDFGKVKIKFIQRVFLALSVVVFLGLVLFTTNKAIGDFFSSSQILLSIFFFSFLYYLLFDNQIKNRDLIFSFSVLLFLLPNIKIHPVSKGLKPIINNPLILAARQVENKEPGKKWIVFGQSMIGNLLLSENINVFNGVKFLPDLPSLKILDPIDKYNEVYNRFAHIGVTSFISGKDSIVFKLNENKVVNDNYSIFVDPCSIKLKEIGIKYVVFSYQPQEVEIRCMTLVSSQILPIYKLND